MKKCIVFLLLSTTFRFCNNSAYNWNVEAIDGSPNLSNDPKLRTHLNHGIRNFKYSYPPSSEKTQSIDRVEFVPKMKGHHHHHHHHKHKQNKNRPNENFHKPESKVYAGEGYRNEQTDEECKTESEGEEEQVTTPTCPSFESPLNDFVGTNLFARERKKCFSIEDVALLTARRDFENLIPKDLPKVLVSDHMVAILMNYFYTCHEAIGQMANEDSKNLAQRAFYDTFGGYLNYYLLPVAKFSFYAGQLSLETVQNLLLLHKECKSFLNVNGNGWRAPIKDVLKELKIVHVEPLHIEEQKGCNEGSFCMHLDMSSEQMESDDKMIVTLPRLDPEDHNNFLGNIWLPFKRKRTFDLRADNAAYVLVKFYETVTRCYQYEHIDQNTFNARFKTWILENVHVHLSDDQFYPGFGAILRIYAVLRHGKKSPLYGDHLEKEQQKEDFDYKETESMPSEHNNLKIMQKRNFNGNCHYIDTLGKSKLLKTLEEQNLKNQNEFYGYNVANQNKHDAVDTIKNVQTPLFATTQTKVQTEKLVPAFSNKAQKSGNLDVAQKLGDTLLTAAKLNQTISQRTYSGFESPLVIAIVLLLIFVILAVLFYIFKIKQKPPKPSKKPPVVKKKAKGRKRKSGGDDTDRSGYDDDEETLLRSDSKSVLTGSSLRSSTFGLSRTVLKAPNTKQKTFKQSAPPVIETTSLDYTSSDPDDKLYVRESKLKAKSVTIDEKPVKAKSYKPTGFMTSKLKAKKESSKSSSWETVTSFLK